MTLNARHRANMGFVEATFASCFTFIRLAGITSDMGRAEQCIARAEMGYTKLILFLEQPAVRPVHRGRHIWLAAELLRLRQSLDEILAIPSD